MAESRQDVERDFDRACDERDLPAREREALHALVFRGGDRPPDQLRRDLTRVLDDHYEWTCFGAWCDEEPDGDAFHRCWVRRASAFFRKMGLSHDLGEDLTQQFFERLIRMDVRGRFEWRSSFRAYCYAMLQRLAISHFRSAKRREVTGTEIPEAIERVSPEEQHARSEELEQVRSALAELPEIDQRIVAASLLEDLSSAELGERLGMTAEAVRQRLARSRRRLKKALSGGGGRKARGKTS
ncbi:MAG: sigma-70 family RNA polymerase sigma factor [Acidobacteriota bacterium]